METFLEILKFTLPALLVLLTAWFILKNVLARQSDMFSLFVGKELERVNAELKNKSRELTLPIRLQAYERMTLFCSRIELSQVLLRAHTDKMSAGELKSAMIYTIEDEFSHNITQQMYMSEDLWDIILLAKSEAISIVKTIGASVGDTASDEAFIQAFIEHSKANPQMGYLQAQSGIKKEVNILF